MEFQEDGLWVQFRIPNNLIGEDTEDVTAAEQVAEAVSPQVDKKQIEINVLILEDDFINAQDMKRIVALAKVNEINTFSNQQEALDSMNTMPYGMALLDVNLKNETSNLVAWECANKGIPFYYLTGYGSSFLEQKAFPAAPVLLKPIQTETLKGIVKQHLLIDDND